VIRFLLSKANVGRAALWLALFSLAAAALALAYIGWFTRYIADDYSYTVILQEYGFWGSQLQWYRSWSGRFSSVLVENIVIISGGLKLARFVPGYLLVLWVAGTYFSAKQLLPKAGNVVLAGLALAVPVTTALLSPNLFESFFWMTGTLTYTLPLVLISWQVGLLVLATKHWPDKAATWLVLAFALAVMIGGMSETSAVLQLASAVVAAAGALALIYIGQRKALSPQFWLLSATVAGAFMALVIVALAPGNATRQALYPDHMSFLSVVIKSLQSSGTLMIEFAQQPFMPLLVLLGGLAGVSRINAGLGARVRGLPLLGMGLLAWMLAAACYAPGYWALVSAPPDRVYITPLFVFVVFTVLAGVYIGSLAAERITASPALKMSLSLLLLASVAAFALRAAETTELAADEAKAYAAKWDRRHDEIERQIDAGQQDLTVEFIPDRGVLLNDIYPDPEVWLTKNVAKYYNVRSIRSLIE
jgi:hypothetical protein